MVPIKVIYPGGEMHMDVSRAPVVGDHLSVYGDTWRVVRVVLLPVHQREAGWPEEQTAHVTVERS